MFCPNCGSANPENQNTCSRCGAQLPIFPVQQPSKKRNVLIAVVIVLSVCLLVSAVYLIFTLVSNSPESTPQEASTTLPTEESHEISTTPPTEEPSETSEIPTESETSMSEAPSESQSTAPTEILTADTQYRLNIFLSNFSEQFFDEYPDDDDYDLVQFAYLYNKINANENITYDEGDYCISETIVDQTLVRFFGQSILHRTLQETDDAGFTRVFEYRDGQYRTPAADGASYCSLSIVSDAELIDEGLYFVSFYVYELDLDIYFQNGIAAKYYALTADEAAATRELTYRYYGHAIVRDYDLDGYATYQLVSYESEYD